MKRYVLLSLCFCTSVLILADELVRIKIVANKEPQEETRGICHLSISATKLSNSDDVRLSVLIDNKDEEHIFFLFNHSYTEKDLKKLNIRFDKKTYGSTDRKLKTCNSMEGDDAIQISPQDKHILKYSMVANPAEIELPIYIAKYKNSKKNKYLILERKIISLNIEIEEEEAIDNDYERLNEAYNILISDLEEQSFCPNKKHSPSLSEQEKPYKERINEIKDEITDITSANNWRENALNYSKYKDLLEKLDNINFRVCEKDCRKHKTSYSNNARSHNCSYSSWTAGKVLSSLVQIYKKLDNGRISKESAIEKARNIKREWTNKACPLYVKMNNATDIKREVEEYYNSIINY